MINFTYAYYDIISAAMNLTIPDDDTITMFLIDDNEKNIYRLFQYIRFNSNQSNENIENVKLWAKNFVNKILSLTKNNYTDDQKQILIDYLIIKFMLKANLIINSKYDVYTYIYNIIINDKNIYDENTLIWFYQNEIRLMFLQQSIVPEDIPNYEFFLEQLAKSKSISQKIREYENSCIEYAEKTGRMED